MDIHQVDRLRTVWDNFSEQNPGSAERIEINGKDVYDLAEDLTDQGLYFREHRVD